MVYIQSSRDMIEMRYRCFFGWEFCCHRRSSDVSLSTLPTTCSWRTSRHPSWQFYSLLVSARRAYVHTVGTLEIYTYRNERGNSFLGLQRTTCIWKVRILSICTHSTVRTTHSDIAKTPNLMACQIHRSSREEWLLDLCCLINLLVWLWWIHQSISAEYQN